MSGEPSRNPPRSGQAIFIDGVTQKPATPIEFDQKPSVVRVVAPEPQRRPRTPPPVEDPILQGQWREAEDANDWERLSELQTAERVDGGIPAGFVLVERPDFIDRR